MEDTKQATLADRTLQQIQHAIIGGTLASGSKINEQDLARQYGVSRGPLREALQRLEQRGLVERTPHIGASVITMRISTLRDLYQVRAELEAMACRLAATQISSSQISHLNALLERQHLRFQVSQVSGFQDDIDFHHGLIEASGNQTLISILTGDLYHQLQLYRYQCSAGRRPMKAHQQHRQILDAIIDGDGDLAALMMRRHIQQGAEHIERVLRTKMENF